MPDGQLRHQQWSHPVPRPAQPVSGFWSREITWSAQPRVSIGGVNAEFKVFSVNYFPLSVPAGAATGPIVISNAGGTSASGESFTVE
jgi:hypothetical protein